VLCRLNPRQQAANLCGLPTAGSGSGGDAAIVQLGCDASQRSRAGRPQRFNRAGNVGSPLTGTIRDDSAAHGAGIVSELVGMAVAAELDAASARRGQRGLGPLGNHLGLVLGDGRENVDRQSVRLRKIDGHEIDFAFHEAADEMHIASKTVELGNDELRPVQPARRERRSELRPVRALSGFNLREFADDLPVASVQVIADRLCCASRPRPDRPCFCVETR
jgi:hypothetical protein